MRRLCLQTTLLALIGAILLAPAGASADAPTPGALYHDGPSGRYLLGGDWQFKLDPTNAGLGSGWQRDFSNLGWTTVHVPNAWNLGDDSAASMAGGIGWYRKDFTLPTRAAALAWIVRFESVNYRSRVWLNGRPVGTNKGAYIPFEFRLGGLKRTGVNHLTVRVDSKRRPTDFPPSGLSTTGVPTGGWWNYSGILREVYLRKVDTADWADVLVRPQLPCGACPASVLVRVSMRNALPRGVKLRLTGSFGNQKLALGTKTLGSHGIAAFTDTIRVAHPRLWTPYAPNLYDVKLAAYAGKRRIGTYVLESGIRSIRISGDGRLLLNGQYLDFRGVGYHEDTKAKGFAIDNSDRLALVTQAKELGATVMRTHYPPHPYLHELADRMGMLLWSEIPVYSNKTKYLKQELVRALAAKELRKNIQANKNHPSVMLWSIGNELSPRPGPVQGYYIRRAVNLAHQLDPTRPVGLAVAAYPSAGCQTEYAPLDVIGLNEYFGWYPGPNGQLFDRTKLAPYLDSARQCYPDKALVVSEFGAEANRDGPVEEKGTWLFQQDFVNFHLGVFATKPWLSGAIYWALNEFRVRPNWDGGNPRPTPPIHQKGLISYDGVRKPAWTDVQRSYLATQQLAPPTAALGRRGRHR